MFGLKRSFKSLPLHDEAKGTVILKEWRVPGRSYNNYHKRPEFILSFEPFMQEAFSLSWPSAFRNISANPALATGTEVK